LKSVKNEKNAICIKKNIVRKADEIFQYDQIGRLEKKLHKHLEILGKYHKRSLGRLKITSPTEANC